MSFLSVKYQFFGEKKGGRTPIDFTKNIFLELRGQNKMKIWTPRPDWVREPLEVKKISFLKFVLTLDSVSSWCCHSLFKIRTMANSIIAATTKNSEINK